MLEIERGELALEGATGRPRRKTDYRMNEYLTTLLMTSIISYL
jgi:hypothetical protein